MALDPGLERFKSMNKDTYLSLYKDKSDSELQTIIRHNVFAIMSQSGIEAAATAGESEACAELLKRRQENQEYENSVQEALWSAPREWEETVAERRRNAILNLSAATSYHGQLIAAVLDETDNLTAQEIRQWADELTLLTDSDYNALLEDLVEEKVLLVNDEGRYSLLSLCTPELFPSNPMHWAKMHSEWFGSAERKFIQHIIDTGKPATEADWIEITWSDFMKENYASKPKTAYSRAKNELSTHVDSGVLSCYPISNTDLNYYYFAMLGEKE